jgi:imidazoleglycerol-phosphate dehydratase
MTKTEVEKDNQNGTTTSAVIPPFRVSYISCSDCAKANRPIRTGVGFLDHMVDQFNSHAQIGIALQIVQGGGCEDESSSEVAVSTDAVADSSSTSHDDAFINRFATFDQKALQTLVGAVIGQEFRQLLEKAMAATTTTSSRTSHFACPLDEALVLCRLEHDPHQTSEGSVTSYNLAPYGKFPATRIGRQWLGKMQTVYLESAFWSAMAKASGLRIELEKISGDNAHHIVESSFKAFARALRNLLDGVDTTLSRTPTNSIQDPVSAKSDIVKLYNPQSDNWRASVALQRCGSVSRKTKETSIEAQVKMDGGETGVTVSTGIPIIDKFYTTVFQTAHMSANIQCKGDLWIDDHHTSEDVSIAIGQVISQCLGSKAGLNRMWAASSGPVSVIVDLSNRPMLTAHGLQDVLIGSNVEDCDGLALEMWEHVLDSLVVQARMTCHIVVNPSTVTEGKDVVRDVMAGVAQAFGESLMYCAFVDQRRAGATASSKGTLSV